MKMSLPGREVLQSSTPVCCPSVSPELENVHAYIILCKCWQ